MSGRWSCETLQVGFQAVVKEAQDTTMDAEEAKLLAQIKDSRVDGNPTCSRFPFLHSA